MVARVCAALIVGADIIANFFASFQMKKTKLSCTAVIQRWREKQIEKKPNILTQKRVLGGAATKPHSLVVVVAISTQWFLTSPQKVKARWSMIGLVARLPRQVPVDCGFAFMLIYYAVHHHTHPLVLPWIRCWKLVFSLKFVCDNTIKCNLWFNGLNCFPEQRWKLSLHFYTRCHKQRWVVVWACLLSIDSTRVYANWIRH